MSALPGRATPFSVSASPPLLVSAYARRGQVNHTVLDYASALKFIEENWRLPPLTSLDAKAKSLASAFDFAAGPRPPALIPAARPRWCGLCPPPGRCPRR